MNFKKYQKYLKYASLIALVFLMMTGIAHANPLESVVGAVVGWNTAGLLIVVAFVIGTILFIIGYVAGLGVTVAGTLINWSLNLNSQILNDQLIKTGWVVTRDIANLGFVFVIILIAFATILQMQSYAMKNTLWKLIVAALLVNFSLVFAGVFIDFSGVLTDFFLSRATNGNLNAAGEGLMNAIGSHRVFDVTTVESTIKEKVASIGNNFTNFVNFIASMAFAVIFTILTAIALFSFAVMFLIRYLSLITLLILAPLAWLAWVWPDTASYWNKWWSEFFKWIWFGPAASFFFYLAISLALTFNNGGADYPQASIFQANGMLIQNFGKLLMQMVSVIGLMYTGLVVAHKMGIQGAEIGISAAQTAKGWATGYATSKASGWARRTIATAGSGIDPATGKRTPSYTQKLANAFSGIPILRDVAGGLAGFSQEPKRVMAEHDKQIKEMTPEMFAKELGAIDVFSDDAWATSLMNRAATEATTYTDPTGKVTPETYLDKIQREEPVKFDRFIESAKKTGVTSQILSSRLDLAPKFGSTVAKEAKKIRKPQLISPTALQSIAVLANLGISDFTKIGLSTEDIGREQIMAIKSKEIEMQKYVNDVFALSLTIPPSTDPKLEAQAVEYGLPNASALAKKYAEIIKHINDDPMYRV